MQTGAVRVSAAFVMRACANTLKDGLRAAIERAGAGRSTTTTVGETAAALELGRESIGR
jgi:hypothetical protein